MTSHLRRLRLLNYFAAGYTILVGLLFLFMFLLPWLIGDDQVPGWLFALIGVTVFVILCAHAAAHVLTGLLVGAGRGRALQTLLAWMQVWSFPLGTAYALYALWVCWVHEPSRERFERAIKPAVT